MAINAMFDRQDEVEATLAQMAQLAAADSNVFTRAQSLTDKVATLTAQVDALRSAALDASAHRAKRDLAKDLSSSPNVVFASSAPPARSVMAVDESPTAIT